MRISVVSFTETGRQLSVRIAEGLSGDKGKAVEELRHVTPSGLGMETVLFTKCRACMDDRAEPAYPVSYVACSLADWAGEQMAARNAMLFIGACGIAVRAIAPFLTDKLHDAPVLVMDERGKYVIPVLSGHVGGANALAEYLARRTGAEPVITTATDLNGKFAVDLFAKRNGFFIVNKDGIAKVSAKVLAGRELTVSVEPGHMQDRAEAGNGPGQRVWLCDEPARAQSRLCLPGEGLEGQIPGSSAMGRLVSYPPAEPVDIVITSDVRGQHI